MDKENPVLNAFIVENHTDVKKDELKLFRANFVLEYFFYKTDNLKHE